MTVVHVDRLGANAIWQVVSPLSALLIDKGHRVIWVRMDQGNRRESLTPPEGVETYDIKVPSGAGFSSFFRQGVSFSKQFKKLIDKENPQIVHTHFAMPGVWAREVASKTGARVISSCHELYSSMNVLLKWMSRLTEKCADHITYVSKTVATSYGVREVELLGENNSRSVIYNGINFERIQNLRNRITDRNPNKILCVGRMVPEKGQHVVINAFSKILVNNPKTELHFCGSGPEEQKLKNLTKSLGLNDSVHFHGWQDHESVCRHMCEATLVVQPSLHEGFGLSLVESLASGASIVASDIGAFREILSEFNLAQVTLLDSQDPSVWGEKILAVLLKGTHAKVSDLAELEKVYSVHANAESYYQIYQS